MVVPRDYDVRYGRHDFVIGINRWAIRVLAYTSLMRDEYPPLRLDMGPREPEPPRPHLNPPEENRHCTSKSDCPGACARAPPG
jgi:hypothetical protein